MTATDPRALVDLTGQTFGCWTVVRDHQGPGGQRRKVWVRCTCGNERALEVRNLLHGANIRCNAHGCTARQGAAG